MDTKTKTKRNIILVVIISILLIISIIGVTYAWFSAIVSGNDNATENVIENATLSIEYTNGEELKGENIVPGWSETKSFSVENTGTETATYNISWANLLNEFVNKEDLVYILTSNNNGGNLTETQLPESGENISILENISIAPQVIQTYTLTVTYKNKNYDQTSDTNKRLLGKIEVNGGKAEPLIKHTVSLTVLNGTINGETSKEVNHMSQTEFTLTPSSEEYTEAIYSCDDEEAVTTFTNNNTLTVKSVTKDTTCTVEYYIPTNSSCFAFDSETGTITDYYDYEGGEESGTECPRDVVIPSTIGGVSVTTIGEAAFYSKQLTTVTIPSSATSISEWAFYGNQLTTATIGQNVTTIGESAFDDNQLTTVTIGQNVTTIGDTAFRSNQLTTVSMGDSVTSIGNMAFEGNQLTAVTIPGSVTTIGHNAFRGNQLTTVTVEKNVTEIGYWAFYVDSSSNPNLISIVNKTGRSFDWGVITSDSSGNNFITGSFTTQTGKTLTVSES